MNKGLKKGLGALAAVASLLALGPLAAANAAQPTRTRIDAFANDGTIAVESADGRTDISKHTINAYLLAPYTSAVATGDTLNEYAVSTGTGYADKVTTAVKAAFPDADKGADGWQVALGDATTTLDEANPMDWVGPQPARLGRLPLGGRTARLRDQADRIAEREQRLPRRRQDADPDRRRTRQADRRRPDSGHLPDSRHRHRLRIGRPVAGRHHVRDRDQVQLRQGWTGPAGHRRPRQGRVQGAAV